MNYSDNDNVPSLTAKDLQSVLCALDFYMAE